MLMCYMLKTRLVFFSSTIRQKFGAIVPASSRLFCVYSFSERVWAFFMTLFTRDSEDLRCVIYVYAFSFVVFDGFFSSDIIFE